MKAVPGKYVQGAQLPQCNWCDKDALYDFKTGFGPWANGCSDHFKAYRAYPDLGVGKAQRLFVEAS